MESPMTIQKKGHIDPKWRYQHGYLHMNFSVIYLSDNSRIELFRRRKIEENPNWVSPQLNPRGLSIIFLDDEVACDELLTMGYTSDDIWLDAIWLQRLQPPRHK